MKTLVLFVAAAVVPLWGQGNTVTTVQNPSQEVVKKLKEMRDSRQIYDESLRTSISDTLEYDWGNLSPDQRIGRISEARAKREEALSRKAAYLKAATGYFTLVREMLAKSVVDKEQATKWKADTDFENRALGEQLDQLELRLSTIKATDHQAEKERTALRETIDAIAVYRRTLDRQSRKLHDIESGDATVAQIQSDLGASWDNAIKVAERLNASNEKQRSDWNAYYDLLKANAKSVTPPQQDAQPGSPTSTLPSAPIPPDGAGKSQPPANAPTNGRLASSGAVSVPPADVPPAPSFANGRIVARGTGLFDGFWDKPDYVDVTAFKPSRLEMAIREDAGQVQGVIVIVIPETSGARTYELSFSGVTASGKPSVFQWKSEAAVGSVELDPPADEHIGGAMVVTLRQSGIADIRGNTRFVLHRRER